MAVVTDNRRAGAADVISAFSTGLAFSDVPAAAIDAAKRSILDTLAVAVAGTRSRAGQGAIAAFAASGAGGAATVRDAVVPPSSPGERNPAGRSTAAGITAGGQNHRWRPEFAGLGWGKE